MKRFFERLGRVPALRCSETWRYSERDNNTSKALRTLERALTRGLSIRYTVKLELGSASSVQITGAQCSDGNSFDPACSIRAPLDPGEEGGVKRTPPSRSYEPDQGIE